MKYIIQASEVAYSKGGKTKWKVQTDQGEFFTWDKTLGQAQNGSSFECISEKQPWKSNPSRYDMVLKLLVKDEGGGQGGGGGGGGQVAAGVPVIKQTTQIAIESVRTAIQYLLSSRPVVKSKKKDAADGETEAPVPITTELIRETAASFAEIIMAVEKDISVPKFAKVLKAAGLVNAARKAELPGADLHKLFTECGEDAEAFVVAVKGLIEAKAKEQATEPESDLPY